MSRARKNLGRVLLARVLAVALLASAAAAQIAVTYGAGCAGALSAPTIAWTGSFVPGQSAAIHLAGAPPGAFVFLYIGTSDESSAFGPLPIDLTGVPGVSPGCQFLTSGQTRLLLNAKPDGTLKLGFKVPAGQGSDLYLQWAVFEQVSPLSVVLTKGLHASLVTNSQLHPVILAPDVVVDHDGDGVESVVLDGSDSHTHQPGHVLLTHVWKENGTTLSTSEVASVPFELGSHAVTLLIGDDHVPPDTLMALHELQVVTASAVPGVQARYHDSGAADPATLLDNPPALADWAEVLEGLLVGDGGGTVGGSPYAGQVLVRLDATVALPASGSWQFVATGGSARRLFIDGALVSGPLSLAAGAHALEARFAVPALASLPLTVTAASGGGAQQPLDAALLTHDETAAPPVLNAVTPLTGAPGGGTAITLEGYGFFPAPSVAVLWGGVTLGPADGLLVTPAAISFPAPPHASGAIDVRVKTPQGTSNARSFTYVEGGPGAVSFVKVAGLGLLNPTAAEWGPDGRLYVATLFGELKAVRFDDAWNVTEVATYAGVSKLPNLHVTGIAIDPWAPASPVTIHVAHALQYADGGNPPVGPSTYWGQVSVLTGPGFDDPVPLVTGLPQSNSGHAVNGMQFDANGDLLMDVGSTTNAGVAAPGFGLLPESPLSGATVKAQTSRPDFDGAVSYVNVVTGLPDADQRHGEQVQLAPGSHVAVHAPGLRNPYDLVVTRAGRLYSTDNGPNLSFGPASTGMTTQAPDPEEPDELLLVEAGNYYGSANRSRGAFDPRQAVWRDTLLPSLPETFTQAIAILPSSSDGILEYTARTFGGQLDGQLVVQKWLGPARRVKLSPDGRSAIEQQVLLPDTGALDLVQGPGGALLAIDFTGNEIEVLVPVEAGSGGVEPLDILPWRAPASGGTPFVIGGRGFGTLGDTVVLVGSQPAALLSVSPTRIRGVLPAQPAIGAALLDVTVFSRSLTGLLPAAFRVLHPKGQAPGAWISGGGGDSGGGELPFAVAGVAAAAVDGTLLLAPDGNPATLALHLLDLDLPADPSWKTLAPRPFPGSAHAAETVAGKLYLIGGLGAGSEGRVQIYDPALDAWSLGASLPWPGGAVGTAVIGGRIYAAGGLSAGTTVDLCAAYDPAANAWQPRASLPFHQGRHHAAAGTDGKRLFLFGGKGFGSGESGQAANGFDSVEVYDPVTNAWTLSQLTPALAPLPVARSGMGRAVFWSGELYVMGGETLTGPGATPQKTYARVDAYNPATNTWRLEASLPTARHGISPVLFQGRIFVAGGSPAAGTTTSSAKFETFTRQ
jgi:N-acetylneuraminic acid mutarotase/glucose/arabinose dehydrogenase